MYMDRVFSEKEAAIDYAREIGKFTVFSVDNHDLASSSDSLYCLSDISNPTGNPMGFIWTKLK